MSNLTYIFSKQMMINRMFNQKMTSPKDNKKSVSFYENETDSFFN